MTAARWIGLDHGTKRVGLAVGAAAERIASPLAVVAAEPLEVLAARVSQAAGEYGAAGVVVGWPLNMDGTEGPQGRLARLAARRLAERTGLDVRLWDERLSSFAADGALAGTLTRKGRRRRQDAVAAAAMLEDFLARDGPRKARRAGEAAPPHRNGAAPRR